ncbi:hypothetical protein TrVFT333_009130 [Trichoderma virens FT-333]|nr:hypothetical protein TrVFT333_009130 [Trichoderma virens FT-333]
MILLPFSSSSPFSNLLGRLDVGDQFSRRNIANWFSRRTCQQFKERTDQQDPSQGHAEIGINVANQLPQEALERRVDDYFPELLAQDLELSKTIFESRSMTAGSPVSSSPSPFDDGMDKSSAAMGPYRASPLSPYQSGYLRVQTLGAIQERNSMVSFLDQQEDARSGVAASESCSATETDASSVYDAAPLFFHTTPVCGYKCILTRSDKREDISAKAVPLVAIGELSL